MAEKIGIEEMSPEIARLIIAGDVLLRPVMEEPPPGLGYLPRPQPNIGGDQFVEINWLVGGDWLTVDLSSTGSDGAEWIVETVARREGRTGSHDLLGFGPLDQPFGESVVAGMREWLASHLLDREPVFVSRWPAMVAQARRALSLNDSAAARREQRLSLRRGRERSSS